MLTCLVPVLFTFYIHGVLKLKSNSGAKGLIHSMRLINARNKEHIKLYAPLRSGSEWESGGTWPSYGRALPQSIIAPSPTISLQEPITWIQNILFCQEKGVQHDRLYKQFSILCVWGPLTHGVHLHHAST